MSGTATIRALEERLAKIEPGSKRAELLESARQFKANWIALGQQLARVFSDKLYEQWGYGSFDHYVTAELHLRRDTAAKLVRSYTFVQSAKPEYLQPERQKEIPSIDVVDFIQKKRAQAPREQVNAFAEEAFDKAWSPRTVSAKWKSLVADDNRSAPAQEDKSQRAVRRAREFAEHLRKALIEVPGLDARALDAVQEVIAALDEATG